MTTAVRRVLVGLALSVWIIAVPKPAFADDCSSPGDCFGVAGSFNFAVLGMLALIALSLLLDFSPVGTLKGILEGVTGRDLVTGQSLSWWERALGLFPGVRAIAAGAASVAAEAAKAAEAAADAAKTAAAAGDAAKAANAAADAAKAADAARDAAKAAEAAGDAAKGGANAEDAATDAAKAQDAAKDAEKAAKDAEAAATDAAADVGKGPDTGTGPGKGPDAGDVWNKDVLSRGRIIQDRLAETDYKGYVNLDTGTPLQNFPLIDFLSTDGTHSISVKTLDPRSADFTSGRWFYERGGDNPFRTGLEHAQELVDAAPGTHVTLDIRVPPGTPQDIIDSNRELLMREVDDPTSRLTVVVETFP
jgi:hypothetical protein